MFFAEMALAGDRREEARRYAQGALRLCEETGLNYMGPIVLCLMAEVAGSEDERGALISRAQSILAAGAPSHNHMFFNSHMITSSLTRGDWKAAEKYMQALEIYTAKEPFPWASFLIERARVLIRIARGERSDAVRGELARLSVHGRSMNLIRSTRALEDALAPFAG
jgi:hypothetical protein